MALLFFCQQYKGEKNIEEFFTHKEDLDMNRFDGVGVIKNEPIFDDLKLDKFYNSVMQLRKKNIWTKKDLLDLFFELLPEFSHKETGKYLDPRM